MCHLSQAKFNQIKNRQARPDGKKKIVQCSELYSSDRSDATAAKLTSGGATMFILLLLVTDKPRPQLPGGPQRILIGSNFSLSGWKPNCSYASFSPSPSQAALTLLADSSVHEVCGC